MGKNEAPPPPDYTPLMNASMQSAELSYKLGQEQLAWAKEQDAMNRKVSDQVIGTALDISKFNQGIAEKDRARYEQYYQPLEDQLIKDAESYASPERQDFEAGRAQAAVASKFNAARQAAIQNLESFGIDPTAVRYAALDRGARVAQGAAEASAGTNARMNTEQVGRALRSEAINVGRGYPGQVAGQFGTALAAGNQGANTGLATTASGASSMGTPTQWQGLGNNALMNSANMQNMSYQNQMSAHKANQEATSGIGSLLGLGASMLMSPTAPFWFEEGGPVPDPEATTGGAIPVEASPSQGAETDDVPARLNAGEFVMPKDTVSWLGEKFFQDLIEKARKGKQNATAKPEMKPALPAAPTFASRQAIPVG